MPTAIHEALVQLSSRRDLSSEAMHAAVGEIMDGRAEPAAIAALLTALSLKGETVDEIVGAARAMHERAVRIRTSRTGLLDTCGTGGSRLDVFNISTAAALVAAAADVPVAKHGNRAATSTSGSADVLEALGVNIELPPERVGACLDELGVGFCYARVCHQAMKHVAPVRSQLPFRTIFNLLGPLTNPAAAEHQLLGTSRPGIAERLAGALAQLGRARALVVCGAGSLDEVSLWGETIVYDVAAGSIREHRWTAETFGLPECAVDPLRVRNAAESAEIIRGVLDGRAGPQRDIVLANAAAALLAAGRAEDPRAGVALAAQAIDAGAAAALCRRLAEWTRSA